MPAPAPAPVPSSPAADRSFGVAGTRRPAVALPIAFVAVVVVVFSAVASIRGAAAFAPRPFRSSILQSFHRPSSDASNSPSRDRFLGVPPLPLTVPSMARGSPGGRGGRGGGGRGGVKKKKRTGAGPGGKHRKTSNKPGKRGYVDPNAGKKKKKVKAKSAGSG
mmetsp:Transcript_45883/g.139348  ORF Transcript_45883/g.139348 Transcript_45883/m.139348 type:complete len:163 (-) Transcript_45883:13-501(-)